MIDSATRISKSVSLPVSPDSVSFLATSLSINLSVWLCLDAYLSAANTFLLEAPPVCVSFWALNKSFGISVWPGI